MPRSRLLFLAPAVLATLALVAAACGDDDEEDSGMPPAATEAPAGSPAEGGLSEQPEPPQDISDEVTAPTAGVIETEQGDNFFNENNLSVALGETVTIRANNGGQAVHNMRIAGVDGEWNSDDDFISDPDVFSAGDSGELEFTAEVAGTYTFRCDFHPSEMGGVIVVE